MNRCRQWRLRFELDFESSSQTSFIKRLLEWRSNWDQSASQKTKLCWITTVFFILFSCKKQNKLKPHVFASKSTAKSHSNLHSEEKGNLKPHQPISRTEKPPRITSSGLVHILVWSADCRESVHKHLCESIRHQSRWSGLDCCLHIYTYSAVMCWISMPFRGRLHCLVFISLEVLWPCCSCPVMNLMFSKKYLCCSVKNAICPSPSKNLFLCGLS